MDRIFVTKSLLICPLLITAFSFAHPLHGQDVKSESRFNLKLKTFGGQQFWTDLLIVGDWKIQRNEMDDHCRLIDPQAYRIAWGTYGQCHSELNRQIEAGDIKPYEGEVVILLHGLMRSRRSLSKMAKYLQETEGYQVILFEYGSSREEVASHAKALKGVIEGFGPKVTKIHFVGHSLGNIVVRHFLNDIKDEEELNSRFGRMVMMGPPNQGSRMARVLKNSFLFTTLAGVSGVELSMKWKELEPRLATPKFDFGIIAGAQSQENQRWSNFVLKGPDDFTVALEETKLVGARDFMVRPLIHSTMMNHDEVLQATGSFLKNGYFDSEDNRTPINSLKDE